MADQALTSRYYCAACGTAEDRGTSYIPVLLLTSIVEPEAVPVPDVPGGGLFAPRPALPANLAWLLTDCCVPS